MKTIKSITSAYLEARKHKRWKTNTLQFSRQLENSVKKLVISIKYRRYQIKPSLCFVTLRPVIREIFAGDFSDRVVHHFVCQELAAPYDKLFINDCYSCRQHKGTGYGIQRMSKFIRAISNNYQQSAYILKLDISGYFMNIDQVKLYQINQNLIKNLFKNNPQKINLLLYLLKKIIFNNPTTNCRRRGNITDWEKLAPNKSLFKTPPGKGLPIGNLTSQLFGNVYLNNFDHFVKEKLKCHYYGRYVDDMVFMHQDKEFLKNIIPQVRQYLKVNLDLEIHPKKIYLQKYEHGLPFLGVIIKPHRIYPGKRLIKNFYRRLQAVTENNRDKSIAAINSYLGNMQKYQSFKRRQKIMTSQIAQQALTKLQVQVNQDYSKIEPSKGPIHT